MVTGYIFTAFLIILGLAVMRFGSIHFKKFKEGKTRIKAHLSGTISFLILLIISGPTFCLAAFFNDLISVSSAPTL